MEVDRSGSDWVRAAGRRLAAGGIGAVAVETLARDLGVTKGSFYWHFRDRGGGPVNPRCRDEGAAAAAGFRAYILSD